MQGNAKEKYLNCLNISQNYNFIRHVTRIKVSGGTLFRLFHFHRISLFTTLQAVHLGYREKRYCYHGVIIDLNVQNVQNVQNNPLL
jgi:hypothetical protein